MHPAKNWNTLSPKQILATNNQWYEQTFLAGSLLKTVEPITKRLERQVFTGTNGEENSSLSPGPVKEKGSN